VNTIDGKFKQIVGRIKRRGSDVWEFVELNVDAINARDSDGLGLYDDDDNGIFIADGGVVSTSSGIIKNTTRVTSGPYTILSTDHIIYCDTDGGAFEVDLPAGVEGTHYKLINCGANTLTVDPNGTERLFGAGAGMASTLEEGENIDIHYNATEGWY